MAHTKAEGSGRMEVEFYVSVFGNIDSAREIVKSDAYKTLTEDMERLQFYYNHQGYELPIGKVLSAETDSKGLKIKAIISNTTTGRDVMALIEDGALKEFSIGYQVRGSERGIIDEEEITYLTDIKLIEVSIVNRAANPLATLISSQLKADQLQMGDLSAFSNEQIEQLKNHIDNEYHKRVLTLINF